MTRTRWTIRFAAITCALLCVAGSVHGGYESAPVSEALEEDVEARGEPFAPPARESQSLGQPAGLFAARPAEAVASKSDGALSALDPRGNGIVRVVGSLAIVIGLIYVLAMFGRRFGGPLRSAARPSGVVQVHARYPIARNQQLMLLQLDRRILLVHRSGTSMTTLTEVKDHEEVASLLARIESGTRDSLGDRFQSLLERFNSEHDSRGRVTWVGNDAIETVDLTKKRNAPAASGSSRRGRSR